MFIFIIFYYTGTSFVRILMSQYVMFKISNKTSKQV